MGGFGKWIKSLMGLKKPERDTTTCLQEKSTDANKSKKWKLWRTTSETSSVAAPLVRAPPRDFHAVRQEWAAVRIQRAFRAFLTKRTVKGTVKIQALVRGWQVRKQLAVTLKCVQALVKIKANARAQHVGLISNEEATQEDCTGDPTVKLAERQ